MSDLEPLVRLLQACLHNAGDLLTDACLLLEADRAPRAHALATLRLGDQRIDRDREPRKRERHGAIINSTTALSRSTLPGRVFRNDAVPKLQCTRLGQRPYA